MDLCPIDKKKYISNVDTSIKQVGFVSVTRFIFCGCEVQYKPTSSLQSATFLTDWSQNRVQIS